MARAFGDEGIALRPGCGLIGRRTAAPRRGPPNPGDPKGESFACNCFGQLGHSFAVFLANVRQPQVFGFKRPMHQLITCTKGSLRSKALPIGSFQNYSESEEPAALQFAAMPLAVFDRSSWMLFVLRCCGTCLHRVLGIRVPCNRLRGLLCGLQQLAGGLVSDQADLVLRLGVFASHFVIKGTFPTAQGEAEMKEASQLSSSRQVWRVTHV